MHEPSDDGQSDQPDKQDQSGLSAHGETADDLIAAAAERGFVVSKRQLAEWHRAGLLPVPEQRHGGKPGSTSVYSVGTSVRLLALCDCRRHHPHRLDEVAWCLWWNGFDVPPASVRGPLEREAATWHKEVDRLRQLLVQTHDADMGDSTAAEDALSDAFLDFLDRTATALGLRKAMLQARKRVGRASFPTVVRVFVEVVSGTFESYSKDRVTGKVDKERTLVEKALGLERARTDRLAAAAPWLSGDTGETLATLSRLVWQYPPGYGLEAVSLDELAQARDEVKAFMGLLAGWGAISEQMFGRGAFGLGAIGMLTRDARPADQAAWILLWRTLRQSELSAAMDAFLSLARQWQAVAQPAIEGVQQLRREVPAMSDVLDPKQFGRGLRSKRAEERHLARIRTVRGEHPEEVDAYFAKHPELQTLAAEEKQPAGPQKESAAEEAAAETPTPEQGVVGSDES
jgi:hypothetical protein